MGEEEKRRRREEECDCTAAPYMLSVAQYPWLDALEGVADVDLVFRADGCGREVGDVRGEE